MVPDRVFDHALSVNSGKAVFGLTYEFWFADKAGHKRPCTCGQVFACDCAGFFVVYQFAVGFDAFQDRGPKACFMRAALRRWNSVTIGLDKSVAGRGPVDGPLDLARNLEFFEGYSARKWGFGVGGCTLKGFRQVICQTAGKVELCLLRCFAVVLGCFPADFYAGEQVCF